MMRQLEFMQ